MPKNNWKLITLQGNAAEPYIQELSSLRIRVFRDYPYLYEGDADYEAQYLETYFRSENSFVALCINKEGTAVGAATAILLADAGKEFQQPFIHTDIDPATVCYFGESVLLPEYRGQGIGKAFMEEREKFARTLPGVRTAAFCAVIRDSDHPSSPNNYRPLDGFWLSRGFSPKPSMQAAFAWRELGEKFETPKPMQFWLKPL